MIEEGKIREAVSQLPEKDRAELAAFLIEGLEHTHYWVSDDEVARRRKELDTGTVQGMSVAELKESCGR